MEILRNNFAQRNFVKKLLASANDSLGYTSKNLFGVKNDVIELIDKAILNIEYWLGYYF